MSRPRTEGAGFATRAIHAGERPDPVTRAHDTPIHATATFAFEILGDVSTLVYPQAKRGGLVRVSVGCEDLADLVEHVELGLSFVP